MRPAADIARSSGELGAPMKRPPSRADFLEGTAEQRRALASARPGVRTRGPSVSVVMPTINEAANLPYVLARMPSGVELVLVDGNSTDGTAEVAQMLWPNTVIVHQTGRGKGDALCAGCAAATGDIIVTIDADGSMDPKEIPRFVRALLNGADYVKGSRYLEDGGSTDLTPIRSFGNRTLTRMVNLFFGTRYTDLCYGYNAFWRSSLERFSIDVTGFEVETMMNIRTSMAGLAITEVPSFERDRINGESNLHVVRDGLRVLRTILRERLPRRPRSAPAI